MAAGAGLGLAELAFATGTLTVGRGTLGLDFGELRTLTFLAVVFGAQAGLYATRDPRPLWRSRPSGWLLLSSTFGLTIAALLAAAGTLMAPLPVPVVLTLLGIAVLLALAIDAAKRWAFPRLGLA